MEALTKAKKALFTGNEPIAAPDSTPAAPTVKTSPAPPQPRITGWHTSQSKSPIDDSPTVIITREAETKIQGWLRQVYPTLYLRRKQNKTEVYIVTGVTPDTNNGSYDTTTVTLRFDQDKAREYQANLSTDREAIFLPRAIPLIRKMLEHDELLFLFTPYNASPTCTTFQLWGLGTHIVRLQEACHWR